MATLIQSKQIQGIVTASFVEGEFKVSGSFIATGSNSIFSNITASAISSSGPIYGVRYTDVQGTPSFIGGTGITIEEVGGTYTITNSATDDSGSDSQTLSIVGDQLTISSGNTITIPTGSGGASSWSELSGIPSGIISGSTQVFTAVTLHHCRYIITFPLHSTLNQEVGKYRREEESILFLFTFHQL